MRPHVHGLRHVSSTPDAVRPSCKGGDGIIAQGGAIINTGSMAAVAANPEQCSYVATKHALLGFSISAFEVLRHHGVKVCIINPGEAP
jgi:short-subunit dehydrogenase